MKIGIFWYHDGRVIGSAASIRPSAQAGSRNSILEPGRVSFGEAADLQLGHCDFWTAVQIRHSALRCLEYNQVPRGRAIFRTRDRRLVVYRDSGLFTRAIKEQIAAFFEVPLREILFRTDPHYTADRAELHRLFGS